MDVKVLFVFLLGVGCTPFTQAQSSFEAFLRSMGQGGGDMHFPGRPSFPGMMDMMSSAGSGSCPYQTHPNKLKFNQVVNNRLITQDCAPGTIFDLSKCSCVNAPSAMPGGGPPAGSDPRMSAASDPNFAQLMSMLQAINGGPETSFPPSMDMQPPPMSAPSKPMPMPGPPSMSRGLTMDIGTSSADQTLVNPIQYKPKPVTPKVTSPVDPALLPDVIPPEVMLLLQQAQIAKSREIGNTNEGFPTTNIAVTSTTPTPMGKQEQVNRDREQSISGQLPPSVLQMLQQASSPSDQRPAQKSGTSGDSPAVPQSVLKALNDISPRMFNQELQSQASDGSGIPTHILAMLNQSLTQPDLKVPPPLPSSRPSVPHTPFPTENAMTSNQASASQASDGSGLPPHILAMMKAMTQAESRVPPPQPTPRPSAPVEPRRTGNAMTSADFPAGGNPMAVLLAQLQRQIFGDMNINPTPKSTTDPFAAFISRAQPFQSPPAAPSGGGPDMAAIMSLLGGGGSSSPMGGGSDMFASLMGGSRGGMPGGPMNFPGGPGSPAGPAPIDMTSFFNEQGQMGAGGGLAGLANVNYVQLQDLDRRGVIDLSDLTPAGLAAASAHFARPGANMSG